MARASFRRTNRRSVHVFVFLIVVSAVGSILGLPLYFRIRGRLAPADSLCRPCLCNCPSRPRVPHHLGKLLQELYADCGGDDPDAREEMQKDLNALLKEQLELTKIIAEESLRRNEAIVKDMKNSAGLYRKEADKCRVGVMTCEEARENAEAKFVLEKKRTAEWERRARERGWVDPSRVYI
ncbi:hypothetical protein MLD38_010507 [Melastoma candidum]|uniref:Uncharacterized protein n=1 Tax=Melastoma candidum TaxID=119954 RepID=A0ACB9R032_9MYRT|nr:hypothetical protein MLD38_010507 [Melastoma candidum]